MSTRNRFLPLLATLFIHTLAFSQKDIAWDIKTGNEVAKQIESSIGLVHLTSAEKTVQAVGDRLVSKLTSNPYTFSFHIVDQQEPNAFALPGGHVYVSRGLLVLLKTEDELAGVLGHEISHVTQRHSAKQRKKILPSILAVPAAILQGTAGSVVAAPLLGAGQLLMSSYSRKQETEADNLGIDLAAKAGYNATQLADILHRLELWVESETGKATKFSLFDDHPMTPERMANIIARTSSSPKSSSPIYDRNELLQTLVKLPFGPNPAKGVFNKNTYLHPTLSIYWDLPESWTYANGNTAAGAGKDKDQVVVTIAGRASKMDTLIENFVNGYYQKTRYKPISDKKVQMTGREGAEVIISGSDRKEVVYTLWFKKDKFTYVILAAGQMPMLDTFKKSALSFRDLRQEDYQKIPYQELMLLAAKEGENLSSFNSRIDNQVGIKQTAIMNAVDESWMAKTNEFLKVILQVPYKIE